MEGTTHLTSEMQAKALAQGHTASQHQNQGWHPALLTPQGPLHYPRRPGYIRVRDLF